MNQTSKNRPLEGKVALLTGAVRRNGLAAAFALSGDGAAIVINTRQSVDEGKAAIAAIQKQGGKALLVKADITNEKQVTAMFDKAVDKFGGLDILVNNAAERTVIPFLETSYADWKRFAHTVIDGAFLCSRAALPHMIAAGWGSIVNVGSVGNYIGQAERAHLGAAKGGLAGMTRSMAREFAARHIQVNCVAPGVIGGQRSIAQGPPVAGDLLARIPVGRKGYCEEVGEAVRWLCQPSQSFITGMTIHVNGGEYMP